MERDIAEIEFNDAAEDDQLRDEIATFYREHPERTLKTLVCRAYGPGSKEYIAIVTRGDRNVDFEKVSEALGYNNIRLANRDEMTKLGLAVGYVSPIDCKDMKVICDGEVERYQSYFDGGNRELLYRKNVNFPRDFKASKVLDLGVAQ